MNMAVFRNIYPPPKLSNKAIAYSRPVTGEDFSKLDLFVRPQPPGWPNR
jgi:hypothetical protein